ncbi:ABC transporter ATP-binding protein [Photobacterium iliopiscarium]|jgi:peptide/nickel transport system ATP-binding protein|uniref:ABC transporter ATP-binding protein n=1 Tax=Photobacterium iliopiscarium TaxID=56192 RepID=A0A2T3MMD0_9GAMM|nr:ABC transporter ATP-binding protein [Photobacterium iliopiscarium]KJG14367.1 sugar ABC transporter ATP-binding protein [Photobacterium iliopiscarium]MCD9468274.1 ABC transporter ATP-binding protein [Photobacterium iliopiscarium]MCD9488257.1 ATP-binding cassette domain-containing protein [Photobacterium iliopiscarium]MCF2245020.1 ATP-binding cassette domain-containing protein [Photobacterium iliopiscarium]PST95217.1 ABC transporter ATP-binding protein [Photobacterium iliopiscarium]
MTDPQISIRNLCVDYITDAGDVRAVNNVSFDIGKGEIFGLAGESGCGKSTVAFSLMRLHKPPAFITGGEVIFDGHGDILKKTDMAMSAFRWSEMSMVFQSAMNALNPVLTMEEQFCDVIMRHTNMNRKQAIRRAEGLLEIVDIHPSRLRDYPHQFSGGMRQRLVIAIALALNPKMIIMDEPTTALDVVVQREILQKIYALKEEFGFSILFITHDLSLMVEFSDRIGIMYSGELIEVAPSKQILETPFHPYTEGLGSSFPPLTGPKTRLTGIPGNPLNLLEIPQGCRFQARCGKTHPACFSTPTQLSQIEPGRLSNCHLFTNTGN